MPEGGGECNRYFGAAAAINELAGVKEIELEGDFRLEPLNIELPDGPVETNEWKMTIEPEGLMSSFTVTFRGLDVVGRELEGE